MMKIDDEIKRIQDSLYSIFKEAGVEKVILFGSFSKHTETRKSDLDLMIVTKTEKRFFDRYDQFEGVYEIVKDRSIDMLIYTPKELARISHRPFIKKILSEGRLIYEH